ncbi:MAG: hypothetical protein GQ535_03510 [Rhodobacteraceae bacterium]|nr:hypothetical protein [Paracoccaceae bacterium]
MILALSGALLFLALSLAPGPRLGALRGETWGKGMAATMAVDVIFWLVSASLACVFLWLAPAQGHWIAGTACAVFLVVFLGVTLARPFQPPPAIEGLDALFMQPLRRVDLWFDAFLIFPAFTVAMASTPGGVFAVSVGALIAAFGGYAIVALPRLSALPAFWHAMGIITAVTGLLALTILGLRLTNTYPF